MTRIEKDLSHPTKRNRTGIILMLLSSLCVCFGQLLWKLSAQGNMMYLLAGFVLYAMGALVMLVAYRFGSLSVLQPMLSTNYIFALLLAYFFLGEFLTVTKLLGISIITFSVILIGGSEKER